MRLTYIPLLKYLKLPNVPSLKAIKHPRFFKNHQRESMISPTAFTNQKETKVIFSVMNNIDRYY